MSRLTRNSAILVKIESPYGTDSVPTGSANALLVSNLAITPLQQQSADRALVRPFMGNSDMALGAASVQCSFDVEFVGSGTVATSPAWAALARACGLAEVLTATVRADYTPVSASFESVTAYYYDDGVLHKLLGARGTMRVSMPLGGIPKLQVTLTGLDGGPVATANPALTLTSWRPPQLVHDAASGDIVIGGTHVVSTAPAFSAGTTYPSAGIELDLGNQVAFNAFLGSETVDIMDRSVTGRIELRATAAQEVALIALVKAGTAQSVGLLHGTVANNKVGVWLPNVQFLNPGKGNRNGVRTVTLDLRALPSAGNDEVRLIASYA